MRGNIRIATPVLATLIELAALGTPGVAKLHQQTRRGALRRGARPRGVRLSLQEGVVAAHVEIVADSGANLQDVGRAVQQNVARAIQDMAGLTVGEINVLIQDVEGER